MLIISYMVNYMLYLAFGLSGLCFYNHVAAFPYFDVHQSVTFQHRGKLPPKSFIESYYDLRIDSCCCKDIALVYRVNPGQYTALSWDKILLDVKWIRKLLGTSGCTMSIVYQKIHIEQISATVLWMKYAET